MPTRVLLRMMLVTLAAAAVIGVSAIFIAPSVTGRAALTALVAAVCIALAMPMSRLLDRDPTRPGGLLGLASIVLAMVVFLAAIWGGLFLPWDAEWKLTATGLLVLVGGVIAAFLLIAWNKPGLGWAARVAVRSDLSATMLFIAATWVGHHPLDANLAMSGGHVAGSGAAAAMCLVGLGVRMWRWQWAGVAAAAGMLALGLTGTWFLRTGDPTWYAAVMSAAFVIGHANVILRVPVGHHGIWAQLAAIGGMACAGVSATFMVMVEERYGGGGSDLLARILGASALVAACGTMAVLIMYRLQKRGAGAMAGATSASIAHVNLTCPACGKAQAIAVTPRSGRCAGCKLVISITIREPRCVKCEYPLLNVKGERCPECGEPIESPNEQPPAQAGGL